MFCFSCDGLSSEGFPFRLAQALPHHTAFLHNFRCSEIRILSDDLAPDRVSIEHVTGHSPLRRIGIRAKWLLCLVDLVSVKKSLELPVASRFLVFLLLCGICSLVLFGLRLEWCPIRRRYFLPHSSKGFANLSDTESWVFLHDRWTSLICPHEVGRKWTLGCIVVNRLFGALSKTVLKFKNLFHVEFNANAHFV